MTDLPSVTSSEIRNKVEELESPRTLKFPCLRPKKHYACFIFLWLVLSLSACWFQKVTHNPAKAASDTNQFLRALYFNRDYARALKLGDEQFQRTTVAENLKNLVDEATRQAGALRSLTADSYLMTPGATMQLFYRGEYEKGVLYHRLVLVGDASSGYKVSGVWFQPDPYPDSPLRRKFDVDIVL